MSWFADDFAPGKYRTPADSSDAYSFPQQRRHKPGGAGHAGPIGPTRAIKRADPENPKLEIEVWSEW